MTEPCPYEADENPIGIHGTCCSFRGNAVALYLFAMGMGPLAIRLFLDMCPIEAVAFANELRKGASVHRETLLDSMKGMGKPNAALLQNCKAKIPDVDWEFSIDKALNTIEAAATWYEKTGQMDCGVRAWS